MDASAQTEWEMQAAPAVGTPAPVLLLDALNPRITKRDFGGDEVNIDRFMGLNAEQPALFVVVIFMESASLVDSDSLKQAKDFHKKYAKRGITTILVVLGTEGGSELEKLAKNLPLPVLSDPLRIGAATWGVREGPHFFIVNALDHLGITEKDDLDVQNGTVRIEGRFDLLDQEEFATEYLNTLLAESEPAGR